MKIGNKGNFILSVFKLFLSIILLSILYFFIIEFDKILPIYLMYMFRLFLGCTFVVYLSELADRV